MSGVQPTDPELCLLEWDRRNDGGWDLKVTFSIRVLYTTEDKVLTAEDLVSESEAPAEDDSAKDRRAPWHGRLAEILYPLLEQGFVAAVELSPHRQLILRQVRLSADTSSKVFELTEAIFGHSWFMFVKQADGLVPE